jgi:hypothetical protein
LKKFVVIIALSITGLLPKQAKAQFSTDAPILLEILANNISQLYELYSMVQTAEANLRLMREISRGLDSALNLYQGIQTPTDPGLYRSWQNVGQALRGLQSLYGQVASSRESGVQRDIDKGVAEAISLNNKVYNFASQLDRISEQIKSHSRSVSPKGAQKLTAQSVGVMVQAQNQSLRTEASQLKLQAQALARENRRDKEQTRRVLHEAKTLKNEMKNSRTRFQTPRL